MKEYLKIGLITFFVSLVLSGLLFTFGPVIFGGSAIINFPALFQSLLVAITITFIIVISRHILKSDVFMAFLRGFIIGGLMLFFLNYLLMPTILFFGFIFIEILYSPGYLLAYLIFYSLSSLFTSSPASSFFIYRAGIFISIVLYPLVGAFINVWRYKRSEQNQEINVQLKGY